MSQPIERPTSAGFNKTSTNIMKMKSGVTNSGSELKKNILQQYGCIKLEHIKAHAIIYANDQSRSVQNDFHMYKSMVFLGSKAYLKIMVNIPKVKANGISNDPMIIKVPIGKFTIYIRATILWEGTNLLQLRSYMLAVDGNIKNFNH